MQAFLRFTADCIAGKSGTVADRRNVISLDALACSASFPALILTVGGVLSGFFMVFVLVGLICLLGR